MRVSRRLILACSLAFCIASGNARVEDDNSTLLQLKRLSLEELGQIEVTSVSKKPEKLGTAAAAITVFTQEDIRESGYTNIAELLRQTPGMQVARIDSSKWAVGSRGFGSQFGKQLLMLVDGRSTYTPFFSGIFWDEQDRFLEDIERIEVIRGPGSTNWGSNAVNGVLNVISKSSKDTQGGLFTIGGGNEQGFSSLRYGGKLSDSATYRVYVKHQGYDDFASSDGSAANDGWDMTHAGFRTDWEPSDQDTLTVISDFYSGSEGSTAAFNSLSPPYSRTVDFASDIQGGNLLGRWERHFSDVSNMSLQFYYDRNEREDMQWDLLLETYDLDFQHRFNLNDRHDIVWGLGYRNYEDKVSGSFTSSVTTTEGSLHWANGFIQDEITLVENRLKLTLGSKYEHTMNTGSELQPSIRLAWTPNDDHAFWGAATRAVRTPSRFDNDGRLNVAVIPGAFPTVIAFGGNPDLDSEEMIAYEFGYRLLDVSKVSFDVSAFYNVYNNLAARSGQPPFFEATPFPPHLTILSSLDNIMWGETYGVEWSSNYQATDNWRLGIGYTWFKDNIHAPTSLSTAESRERQSPSQMFNLQSMLDLSDDLNLGISVNYMDRSEDILTRQAIPSYLRLDLRLGWQATDTLHLSLVGQNLLDPEHPEFGGTSVESSQIQRSFYAKAVLSF